MTSRWIKTHSYLAIPTSTNGSFEGKAGKIYLGRLLFGQLWGSLHVLLDALLMNLVLVKLFCFFLLEILNYFDEFSEVHTTGNCA